MTSTLTVRDQGKVVTLARAGRVQSVRLMLDAGFDIEAGADDLDATALLCAASNADVPMLEPAAGARGDVKHEYDGAPLGTCITALRTSGISRDAVPRLSDCGWIPGETAHEDELRYALADDLDDIAEILESRGVTL